MSAEELLNDDVAELVSHRNAHTRKENEVRRKEELKNTIVEVLRDSLRLEVNETTESVYVGGMDGSGNMYRDHKSVNIQLWADIDDQEYKIDEIDFDV